MNSNYITLLTSALILTACGSDVDTSPSQSSNLSQQTSPKVENQQVVTTSAVTEPTTVEKDIAQSAVTPEATIVPESQVPAVANQILESKFELPLGRLTGIIDTGTYKQAIVDDQGKVIRLKEGGEWHGWIVSSIDQDKITVSQSDEIHSLSLLSEFRSPQLTETELNSQAVAKSENQPINDTQQAADAAPQFSEEQLTELRSRLLIGR